VALATPQVIGDLQIPSPRPVLPSFQNVAGDQKLLLGALIGRTAFKIAEDENPRPQDRAFVAYNYFNNVGGEFSAPGVKSLDVHRETFGFEKTLLDGQASLGMRLPYLQFAGTADEVELGDLSIIGKYTLFDDHDHGTLVSTGMVVTPPTGGFDLISVSGDRFHTTVLQPYVGFIWDQKRFFVQGFSSLAVPLDSRDITMLFNDFTVGSPVYQNSCDGLLTSITPVFEVHVTTPLNHRGSRTLPVGLADIVDLTAGTHFVFHKKSVLTVGVATPVTGPQPFDVEAIVQFNYKF
jgi:hypothetical protein